MDTKILQKGVRLVHAGMKSHDVARGLGITENELAEALEDEAIVLRSLERLYNEKHKPQVEKDVKDLIDSIPEKEKRNVRLSLLRERMQSAKENKDISNLKTYVGTYHVLMGLSENIEPEQVLRAREFPIENLLKVDRMKMAKCPFHEDKTPSMNCRNNFYYCHGCGETGDVISLVMKLENLTFPQAVKRLN